MDQAAADRVKQIREYLSKMTPGEWIFEKRAYDGSVHYAIRTVEKFAAHPWSPRFIASLCGSLGEYIHNRPLGDYRNDPEIEADADGICKLRTDAEWLLSQLSASEERVRALEKGVALIRDCADPKTSSLTSSDAACMAIQMAAKSLLPSPPQVEETK